MKTWVLGLMTDSQQSLRMMKTEKAAQSRNCMIAGLITKDYGLRPAGPSRWVETVTWISPHKGHVYTTTEEGARLAWKAPGPLKDMEKTVWTSRMCYSILPFEEY